MIAVDRCHDQLDRAGWSLGEWSVPNDNCPVCIVRGTNGEKFIDARGETQSGAKKLRHHRESEVRGTMNASASARKPDIQGFESAS